MSEFSGVDVLLLVAAAFGVPALIAIILHMMQGTGWFSERISGPPSGGRRQSWD